MMITTVTCLCYLYILLSTSVTGEEPSDVEFQCDAIHCLNQDYEYQCTVTNETALIFTIRESRRAFLGQRIFLPNTAPIFKTGPVTMTGNYFVELLECEEDQPLVANITISIREDMQGDIVECAYSLLNQGEIVVCTINISALPTIDSLTVHSDSFTPTSVMVSWQSSSPCITKYQYVLSGSNILEQDVTSTGDSDITVVIEDLQPSNTLYCVVVNAIDSGNRIGPGSRLGCWLFNVPFQPNIVGVSVPTVEYNVSTVFVTWSIGSPEVCLEDNAFVQPDLIGFEVIISDLQDSNRFNQIYNIPANITSYQFLAIPNCRTYHIEVIAINAIGRSPSNTTSYNVPGCIIIDDGLLPRSPSSTVMSTSTLQSTTPQSTESSSSSFTDAFSSPEVSAGVAVAITAPVFALLSSLITLLVVYMCTRCTNNHKLSPALTRDPVEEQARREALRNQSSLTQNAAYIRSNRSSHMYVDDDRSSEVYECVDEYTEMNNC